MKSTPSALEFVKKYVFSLAIVHLDLKLMSRIVKMLTQDCANKPVRAKKGKPEGSRNPSR